jgi:hypothetical protein
LDPASIAFAALAEEYRRAGKFEAAVATCQAGLQRHPAYVSARVTLGRALLEMGRFEEAREELEQVLRVAPENLSAIRGLAEIHHRWGVKPDGDAVATEQPAEQPVPAPEPVEAPAPIRLSSLTDTAPATPAPVEDQPRAAEAAPVLPPPSAPAPAIVRTVPSPPASAPPPAPKTPPATAAPIVRAKSSAPLMAPPPRAPAAPIARAASPAPGPIVPPAQPPNPDQAALPALEGLLAAVRRARAALPGSEASGSASNR